MAGIIAIWAFEYFNKWQAMLYVPAGIVVGIGIIVLTLLRDTPQSVGLPPIEKHRNDYHDDYSEKSEKELSAKEILINYVFNNKLLW